MSGIGDHLDRAAWELAGALGHRRVGVIMLAVEVEDFGVGGPERLGEIGLLTCSVASKGTSQVGGIIEESQPKVGVTQGPLAKERRLVPLLEERHELAIASA